MVHEQRLVDPAAAVGDVRTPARTDPVERVIARERSTAVDVAEQDPVGVDAEPVHDAP